MNDMIMMKKHRRFAATHTLTALTALALAVMTTVVCSCSDEESLTADFKNPSSNFLPAADDQSEEAQLRRQFKSDTDTYLLFNDTLQHQLLGTDINGTPRYFTETIDLNYTVGQTSSGQMYYTYSYLKTIEQKRVMTDFLKAYLLPHLTKSLKPFSWFVCDNINFYADSYQATVSHPYSSCNQRCVAIAGNYLVKQERTEDQKLKYAQRILNGIIGQLAVNKSEAFTEFYKFNAAYYGADYTRFGYEGRPSTDELLKIGFLSSTGISGFPSMSTDLSSYALLVIQYSDAELATKYAAYPIVLQKAAIVRKVLTDLGYVF